MRLEKILQAPELTDVRVLAAGRALQRHVNWVTAYELLDELSLVEAGDLILTDGFDLHSYGEDYPALCRRILRQGACGLGLVPGPYLTQVPGDLLQAAWEMELPLYFLPPGREVADYAKLIIGLITHSSEDSPPSASGSANSLPGATRRICCLSQPQGEVVAAYREKLAPLLRCRCAIAVGANPSESFLLLEGELPTPRLLRESLDYALAELALDPLPSLGVSDQWPPDSDPAPAQEQARRAMELGLALSGPGKIAFHENIALYETFLGRQSPDGSLGYSQEMLERLTAHDRIHHSDLFGTLKAYLQCQGNHRQTAAQLGIHRHTLKTRLEKIEDLTACPLSGVGRVNYEVALAYHHLYRIKR